MESEPRTVQDSQVVMTELVLPNDTNQLGNLLGGRLMHWIDIAAALCAMRHSHRVCVTASVDGMSFHAAIKLGQVVILKASINRVFNTSMEVGCKVEAERVGGGPRRHILSAYLTFVATDANCRPRPVPPLRPETPEDHRRYLEADLRRRSRLRHAEDLARLRRPEG